MPSTPRTTPRATPCCGCCCDFRRAVIIVDMIIIIIEAITIILLATSSYDNLVISQDEDVVRTEMIFSIVSIVTGLISIYGAFIFNIWPVYVNVGYLLIGYIAGVVYVAGWCKDYVEENTTQYEQATCSINGGTVVMQGILMLLWIYPHIGFIVQVGNGTLTSETYENEKRSCCSGSSSDVVGAQRAKSPDTMEQGRPVVPYEYTPK
mmetsp:Transcript_28268/g.60240  ORF Transcript_28268/g.60240 Transcript_28268/m.60240 type:complete len:207 (+) Transcript_28268:828-1448(+)|eukprot:CAMPEP_0172326392 /NCGR_PEP_ID=MMETSP1058-20130122/56392_1 /TAXON_ID=83371 /ORGANISM="Detonula confervacea, Strain CCMP 353" /LENGTH=206 /DNA_ID=CAMNT_0013043157 /DNA_START=762 /DNA_END=1382 /DNA_ORIENTATION=+